MKNDESGIPATDKADPIALLFGGMAQLGPGSDDDTLKVLDMLPRADHKLIVDAGCGSGRQTLALAKKLGTLVNAVDTYASFLADLERRAAAAGIGRLVKTHCMDMALIPGTFREIDLLWSEGAAYSIGFPNALRTWHPAVKSRGFVVASELTWLRADPPEEARKFFRAGYPEMRSDDENRAVVREAGYSLIGTHLLSGETWVKGYYDVLGPRAKALLDHPDPAVREFAAETLEEIRIFACSEGSYGYIFYLMQRP